MVSPTQLCWRYHSLPLTHWSAVGPSSHINNPLQTASQNAALPITIIPDVWQRRQGWGTWQDLIHTNTLPHKHNRLGGQCMHESNRYCQHGLGSEPIPDNYDKFYGINHPGWSLDKMLTFELVGNDFIECGIDTHISTRSETCRTEAQFCQNWYMIKKESLPDRPKFCQSGSAVRHLFWRL